MNLIFNETCAKVKHDWDINSALLHWYYKDSDMRCKGIIDKGSCFCYRIKISISPSCSTVHLKN